MDVKGQLRSLIKEEHFVHFLQKGCDPKYCGMCISDKKKTAEV